MIRYLGLLLFFVLPLFSNEPITFQDLDNSDHYGKQVSIQGFLYKTPSGSWILASEPNLKSCCIGSKDKAKQQIMISGELPKEPPLFAVSVHGKLGIEVEQTKYTITDAVINDDKPFPIWLIGSGIAAIIAAVFIYRKRLSSI